MATASIQDDDNRDLECPVCHELFRTPKMLPSGHTLCLAPCMQQLTKGKPNIKCPECRTDHQLPGGSVDQFPTNILVVRMMKKDAVAPKSTKTCCPTCSSEKLLVKCFHCTLLICENCRMKHTKELEGDVSQLLHELREEVKQFDLSELEKDAVIQLGKVVDIHTGTINTSSSTLIEAVRKRKTVLLEEVKSYQEVENAEISSRVANLKNKLSEIGIFCDSSLSSINTADIIPVQDDLLTVWNACQEQRQTMLSLRSHVNERTEMVLKTDLDQQLTVIKEFGTFREKSELKIIEQDAPTAEPEVVIIPNPATVTGCAPMNKPDSVPRVPSIRDRQIGPAKLCIGRKGAEDGLFNNPTCLAVCAKSGNIAVGDSGNGRIQVFDEDGEHLRSTYKGTDMKQHKFKGIRDIAFNSTGSIVALEGGERHTHEVHILWSSGGSILSFSPGAYCNSFAISRDDKLFICCQEAGVRVYNQYGKHITTFSPDIPDVPFEAQQIACMEDGTTLVTNAREYDYPEKTDHICIFNENHQLIRRGQIQHTERYVKHIGGRVRSAKGKISYAENKYILIPDPESHRVYLLDLNFNHIKTMGTPGCCRGQLHVPTGAAVTRKGELVVISQNNMLQFF